MGSDVSRHVGDLTHSDLFKLTNDIRSMVNFLLKFTLKEMTVQEFLLLSNPKECNKYVVFLANEMDRQFYEMGIGPINGPQGKIMFRPIREFTEPSNKKKKSLCLILSYYYTRIFQIYGALALTLIDDINAMSESGVMHDMNDKLYAPGFKKSMHGGDLGYFIFLKEYFSSSSSSHLDFYPISNSGKGHISFTHDNQVSNKQNGEFKLNPSESPEYRLMIISKESDNDNYKYIITVNKLVDDTGHNITIPNDIEKRIEIRYSQTQRRYLVLETTIPDFFNKYFTKLMSFLKKYKKETETTEYKNSTQSQRLVEISKRTAYGKEEGTHKSLKLQAIITNMQRVKPLGHCIARAVQLLKVEPLNGKNGITQICKTSIFSKDDSEDESKERGGLVIRNKSLDTSPGLYSMSLLFYDFINIGTPNITKGKTSIQQYKTFMKNMAILYEGKEKKEYKDDLTSIRNKRDSDICGTLNTEIPLSKDTTNKVYDKVKEMFMIQYKHAKKCGEILNQLFQIKMENGQAQIQLHPKIIKEGFPAITEINRQARELLIKYYTNCEKAYVEGIKIIITDVTQEGRRTTQAQSQVKNTNVTKKTVAQIQPAKPVLAGKKKVTFNKKSK